MEERRKPYGSQEAARNSGRIVWMPPACAGPGIYGAQRLQQNVTELPDHPVPSERSVHRGRYEDGSADAGLGGADRAEAGPGYGALRPGFGEYAGLCPHCIHQ